MKRSIELLELDEGWVALYHKMREWAKVAPPQLSVAPEHYDPDRPNVLYIGKATYKLWCDGLGESFEKLTAEQCRRLPRKFVKSWVEGGEWRASAFWEFARKLSAAAGETDPPMQNLIWGNIAKIGLLETDNKDPNPWGRELQVQHDLAVKSLRAEIACFRPRLVAFVTNSYAENWIGELIGDESKEGATWHKKHEDRWLWWRPAIGDFPAILWTCHPQHSRVDWPFWLKTAKKLLG